jgi:D-galactarolactone cycloisomerase
MRRRDLFPFALFPGLAAAQRASNGPLKITKVEGIVIRTPADAAPLESLMEMPPLGSTTGGLGIWNRLDHASPSRFKGRTQATLVKVSTAQGLTGWGECHAPAAPRVHQTLIRDALAPLLVGEDARNVEALWDRMYSSERLRGYSTGFFTEAIAGIDLALWDLLGKFVGQPVYRLLGGQYRPSIPTYIGVGGATLDDLRANTRHAFAQGFRTVKMGLSKGSGTRDLDRVAAVAETVRGQGQLLVDSLGAYKLHEAVSIGRQLDQLKSIGWWEDALMPEDTSGYPKLAEALDLAVCVGETYSNRFQFRDLFASRGADIINPDICRSAGLSETRRIATLADAHGVLWSPHVSTGTALYWSASVHLAVATPNCVIMEGGNLMAGAFGNALLSQPLTYTPGFAQVPEGPGFGIEFDEKALAKVTAA